MPLRTFGTKLREYSEQTRHDQEPNKHKNAFTVTVSPEQSSDGLEHYPPVASSPSLFYLQNFHWKRSPTNEVPQEHPPFNNRAQSSFYGDQAEPEILERMDILAEDDSIICMLPPDDDPHRQPVMHVRWVVRSAVSRIEP